MRVNVASQVCIKIPVSRVTSSNQPEAAKSFNFREMKKMQFPGKRYADETVTLDHPRPSRKGQYPSRNGLYEGHKTFARSISRRTAAFLAFYAFTRSRNLVRMIGWNFMMKPRNFRPLGAPTCPRRNEVSESYAQIQSECPSFRPPFGSVPNLASEKGVCEVVRPSWPDFPRSLKGH